ncbi:hypothetical protein WSS15_17710 [Acetobacter pasteurianus]|nr:hypothetical protein WSS15_17710 [Acetobacter pasteurianus]
MADINRRTVTADGFFHHTDGAVHPCAETTWACQQNLKRSAVLSICALGRGKGISLIGHGVPQSCSGLYRRKLAMKKHIENRLCPKPIKVTEVVAYAKDAWDATRFTASKP